MQPSIVLVSNLAHARAFAAGPRENHLTRACSRALVDVEMVRGRSPSTVVSLVLVMTVVTYQGQTLTAGIYSVELVLSSISLLYLQTAIALLKIIVRET